MKFEDLTEDGKRKVKKHWKQCLSDNGMNCDINCQTIEEFWENHKKEYDVERRYQKLISLLKNVEMRQENYLYLKNILEEEL